MVALPAVPLDRQHCRQRAATLDTRLVVPWSDCVLGKIAHPDPETACKRDAQWCSGIWLCKITAKETLLADDNAWSHQRFRTVRRREPDRRASTNSYRRGMIRARPSAVAPERAEPHSTTQRPTHQEARNKRRQRKVCTSQREHGMRFVPSVKHIEIYFRMRKCVSKH